MELIYADRTRIADLENAIYSIMDRANDVIEQFHELSGRSITTHEAFLGLIADPVAAFDRVLFEVADIKGNGKKPDPGKLAELFNLDREGWMRVAEDSLTKDVYLRYRPYLIFSEGIFTVNSEAILKATEQFKPYAKTEAQIEAANHFRNLVTVLNAHLNKGYTGPATLQQIGKLLNLRFADNRLYLDAEILANHILKLK